MHNFHIFTMVYGEHHIELFKRAVFKSLNWPKNKAMLEGKNWCIYTKREHFEDLDNLFKDSGFNLKLFEIGESMRVAGCGYVKTVQCEGGVILLNGLRDQIALCLQTQSKILFAPPDTIFGDGSVESILKADGDLDACVFVSHMRVLPKIIDQIEYMGATSGAISNEKLCQLSLENAHASWTQAEIDHKHNNSYVGGIAWKRIGEGLISVQHRLPTPYLIGFNRHDIDFWWSVVSFGALDHTWPGDRLVRQERMRYIGSSDAAFICEVTDHDKNCPPLIPPEHRTGDAYWGDRIHHSTNRMFNVIWRHQ